jgi:acyl-CoA synthetase (AMP-forming)/AMP-acid ligase II
MDDRVIGSARLDTVLRVLATAQGDEPAIVFIERGEAVGRISWRELDEAADAICRHLIDRGVTAGYRCAVFLQHDRAALAAVYGIMRAGAIVVPVDPQWGEQSIAAILRHADVAHAIGADPAFYARFAPDAPFTTYADLPRTAPGGRLPDRDDADEVALLAFTSGTTSEPKGVVITHRQIRFAYNLGRSEIALSGARRFGCFFRLSGLGIMGVNFFFAAAHGATTYVFGEPGIGDAKRFWRACQRWEIDFVYLVPALVQLINRLAEPPDRALPRPLCACAAAPLPRVALDHFQTSFDATLINIYGLTELTFAIMFGARDADGRGLLTIGDGGPIGTRLVDQDGAVLVGAAEGELQIASPSACAGYWRNPAATAALFDGEWLRTGDIAARDDAGRYVIVGRKKDVVIRGGFNIHLSEVDEVLLAHPDVIAAAAVGVPDPLYGEQVIAAVCPRDGTLHADAMIAWCRARLGTNRAPKRVVFMDRLPVNGAGKVVRRLVKMQVERHLQERVR